MKLQNYLLPLFFSLLYSIGIEAQQPKQQTYTQTVRGTVIDKENQRPIAGASIILVGSNPLRGCISDDKGNFQLDTVHIGKIDLKVRFMGYYEQIIPNIQVNSGKEVVLNIELVEAVNNAKEIVIVGNKPKDQANNEMAVVSARMFTVDEAMRFAGSLGDPARMAANFAGVSGANDSRNDIIIRGNSPSGLLWRVEGIDIPSPNHFASQGTTGGPVSMLNNNLLRNSDFFTSAFPAEYGNALSGVFDIRMRNGNNQKFEFTGQAGFNGFELMGEGPIDKAKGSSFIASYRYSVLGIFDALGINLGPAGIPKYQDLSFKINLPNNKIGHIEMFGLGGTSTISLLDSKKKSDNFSYGQSKSDIYNGSDMGVFGLTHTINLSQNSYLKTILSSSIQRLHTKVNTVPNQGEPYNYYDDTSTYSRSTVHVLYNNKINAKNTFKTGVIFSRLNYEIGQRVLDTAHQLNTWQALNSGQGHSYLGQAYAQWKHDFNEHISLLGGIQAEYFLLNKTTSIEPRAGLKYKINGHSSLNFGYSIQGQIQPLFLYFTKTSLDSTHKNYIETNHNMGFSRSQHYVIGYDRNLGHDMRIKLETYYQYLFNMPVTMASSSFSTLNDGTDFVYLNRDSLVNKGSGRNYGLELTFEKFFSNNYYFLFTASLFDSKYKGSDGVLRNTAFNGKYATNLLIGKDFKLNARNTITSSGKVTWAGGRMYTPLNLPESIRTGVGKYEDDKAYSLQYPDYLKIDIRIGFKMNMKRMTQEWALDIQNLSNQKNVLTQSYDSGTHGIKTEYQLGIFPMFLYKIQF